MREQPTRGNTDIDATNKLTSAATIGSLGTTVPILPIIGTAKVKKLRAVCIKNRNAGSAAQARRSIANTRPTASDMPCVLLMLQNQRFKYRDKTSNTMYDRTAKNKM
jgi:hypothetical protein